MGNFRLNTQFRSPEILSEFSDRLSLFLALCWDAGFILDGNDESGEPVPSVRLKIPVSFLCRRILRKKLFFLLK